MTTLLADIERQALHCPVLHDALARYRKGDITLEVAMMAAAWTLSRMKNELLEEKAHAWARQPAVMVIRDDHS